MQNPHVINISEDWQFYKAHTFLSLHKKQVVDSHIYEWHKIIAIKPCKYKNKLVWAISTSTRKEVNKYYEDINGINIYLNDTFSLSLNQEAIQHLEKLASILLMQTLERNNSAN